MANIRLKKWFQLPKLPPFATILFGRYKYQNMFQDFSSQPANCQVSLLLQQRRICQRLLNSMLQDLMCRRTASVERKGDVRQRL